MEKERFISKHEAIVQPFLEDAFKEGAHRKMLNGIMSTKARERQQFRQLIIGVVYNDTGSTATLEELADKYGTFRQSISDSNRRFLTNL